jgi:hypothetical protein
MKTKLFIGTRVTPDLKIRLASIIENKWQLIPFEGKEYIGFYLEAPSSTISQLRSQSRQFIELLQHYLPDLRTDTLPIVVFPQLFLG